MKKLYKDKALEFLSQGDLNAAVDYLKKGLKRDPYSVEGHRLLGDIYLIKLDHPVYALVEYRKLQSLADDLREEDKIRLAWAYQKRGFDDKAADLLNDIDIEALPSELEIFDQAFDIKTKYRNLREKVDSLLQNNSPDLHEKYKNKGSEHKEFGNFYQAQKAFEKALNYGESEKIKVELASCLIQRGKFPDAVQLLREVQGQQENSRARELLDQIYSRLGLNHLNEIMKINDQNDESSSEGDSRTAS